MFAGNLIGIDDVYVPEVRETFISGLPTNFPSCVISLISVKLVCSFGDGVKHIHFWILPRPPEMRPGMHWVMFQLDLRYALTRRLGLKRWLLSDEQVADIVGQTRERIRQLL